MFATVRQGSRVQEQIVFLRLGEVLRRTGVRKTKLYDLIKQGDFPKPCHQGKASVWPEHEVSAYQQKVMDRR